jgi:hypothetical protein
VSKNAGPGPLPLPLLGSLIAPCAPADGAHPATTRMSGKESERIRCGKSRPRNAANVDIKIG